MILSRLGLNIARDAVCDRSTHAMILSRLGLNIARDATFRHPPGQKIGDSSNRHRVIPAYLRANTLANMSPRPRYHRGSDNLTAESKDAESEAKPA
ncbi:hypothetical protein PoB_002595800 [Plakobranchus ocellatus]|uniref:Uncharacterized protein n=1 Tax=Plakobranchus ocellatus TaxID=259542 RepID=A0AAV3ZX67_9GAST|nr:hypothetical protein PoB_002595800 [Plakobranchus ocellatus]